MNDEPRTQPAPPTTAAPPPTADEERAGGGLRALAVLLALVLAFGAAVMIVAAGEISDTPTAEEVTSGEEPLPADGEVYDGSESERSISVALGYASGVVGALGVLAGLAFAITGRRGRLFVWLFVGAVVLAGIALLI